MAGNPGGGCRPLGDVEARGEFTLVVAPVIRAKRADYPGPLTEVRGYAARGSAFPRR